MVVHAFAVMCMRLQTQKIHARQQQKSEGNGLKQCTLFWQSGFAGGWEDGQREAAARGAHAETGR